MLVEKRNLSPKQLCAILNGDEYKHLRPTTLNASSGVGSDLPEQTVRQWHTKAKKYGWEGLGFKRFASKSDVFKDTNGDEYIIWENAQLRVITFPDKDGVYTTVEEYRNKLGKNGNRMTEQSYYARLKTKNDNPKSGFICLTPDQNSIDLTKSKEFNVVRQETPVSYSTSLNNRTKKRKLVI